MRYLLITALALVLPITPTFADAEPLRYNRVHLDESAQIDIDNDLMVVVMFAQAEGRDATAPADDVNRRIDWAVNLVKSHPGIKVQTLGYTTSAIYNKEVIRGWRVNQSLRFEGSDSREIGDLIARLQEQLQVQSIGYQVSEEQRRIHLDALTAEALKRFQARARHIAGSLGRKDFRLVQLHVNANRVSPMPVARGMMFESAKADVAPARIEAGTQQMTVSVNGEIELSDD